MPYLVNYNTEHHHKSLGITHTHPHEHVGDRVECETATHVHHRTAEDAVFLRVSKKQYKNHRRQTSPRNEAQLIRFVAWLRDQKMQLILGAPEEEVVEAFLHG